MADERRRVAAREVGILLLAASVYFGVRVLVEGSSSAAIGNAERTLDLERRLGIDIEQGAQAFVLDHPVLRTLGNLSYVWLHWPLLIAVLIALFQRDRVVYLRLRRTLCASGLAGLALFWLVPTAPPRFMPGFEGTVSDTARTHYLRYPLSWANQYAAFPSFHIGWTLVACLALAATFASRRAKVIALVPAVLVGSAVVTTGNHYVVDVVTGTVIAVTAYWWFGRQIPTPDSRTSRSAAEWLGRADELRVPTAGRMPIPRSDRQPSAGPSSAAVPLDWTPRTRAIPRQRGSAAIPCSRPTPASDARSAIARWRQAARRGRFGGSPRPRSP